MKTVSMSRPLPPAAPFAFGPFVRLLAASLAGAGIVGAAAAWAEQAFAPLGVFPIVLGLAWGALVAGFAYLCHTAHRPSVWLVLVVSVCLLVGTQHYTSYRLFRSGAEARQVRLPPAASLVPEFAARAAADVPQSMLAYLRLEAARGRDVLGHMLHGSAVWASWAIDAALVVVAACVAIVCSKSVPYCPKCRSWYRVVRAGTLDTSVLAGHESEFGLPVLLQQTPVEFQLGHCAAGCGLAELELSWRQERKRARAKSWLSPDERNRLTALIDRAQAAPGAVARGEQAG